MKWNRILIFSALLLAIVAIGAVSASEDICDVTAVSDEGADEAISQTVDESQAEEESLETQMNEVEIIENDNNQEAVLKDVKDEIHIDTRWNQADIELEDELVYVNSTSERNGTLNIYVNGEKTYNHYLENGSFYQGPGEIDESEYYVIKQQHIYPKNLGITVGGLYTIKVTFIEDGTSSEVTLDETQLYILSCKISSEYDFASVDETIPFTVTFPIGLTGKIAVYDGQMYWDDETQGYKISKDKYLGSANIINGKAILKISGFDQRIHNLLVEYTTERGNGTKQWQINVIKNFGNISVSVSPTQIILGNNIVINFKANTSNDLHIFVDGKEITYKNVSSQIHLVSDLALGTHTVKVLFNNAVEKSYYETDYPQYTGSFYSKTFTITVKLKDATNLIASNVNATYNVLKKLVITLRDANGKPIANKKVSVKVGAITKTLITNANGQVSVAVNTLVPKSYTAIIKFAGDETYKASTASAKVIVKKAKVKIKANKKTFKVKTKVKKVKATLKNNKGKALKKVKLTLKIGKKIYKATTNKKGIATFKVKLTKKGKYTGIVKFKGSKYYKAASKKIKITLKK